MQTKLLLADDSVTIQKVVGLTFAGEDVQIVSVADGDAAIEKARAFRPDVVLADVFMPGRNGYEVCATMKSDPELAAIPVVLLVGTFEPFDEIEAARVKCDAYLTKPFDTAELIGIVRSLARRGGAGKPAVAKTQAAGSEAPLVTDRTRESFLGAGRILDVFDFPIPQPAAVRTGSVVETPLVEATAAPEAVPEPEEEAAPAAASQVIPFPGTRPGGAQESAPAALSEDVIDQIVEKVVRRMSQDIVREIAWEVVPELSESMIRQFLNELKLPDKK